MLRRSSCSARLAIKSFVMSSLLDAYRPAHYEDQYSVQLIDRPLLAPRQMFERMFKSLPWWIAWLMKLRGVLVKPLGLKGGEFEQHVDQMIIAQDERELVWGMDDRHLGFYVSMRCEPMVGNSQTVSITTVVKFNNAMGKVYFWFIKPFHRAIIGNLLHRLKRD